MAASFRVLAAAMAVGLCVSLEAEAANEHKPSMGHGAGMLVAGLTLELPKTVLDATMNNPPVVGTVVGLLAGTAGALQKTVAGLVEICQAFKPWGF